jgi:GT2 family glycosyltransferase
MGTATTTATDEQTGIALAVVIHDSLEDLRECFSSQLAAARELDCPLVVVDNASADEGAKLVEGQLDPARGEHWSPWERTLATLPPSTRRSTEYPAATSCF